MSVRYNDPALVGPIADCDDCPGSERVPASRASISHGGSQIVSFASGDCGVDHRVFRRVDCVSRE